MKALLISTCPETRRLLGEALQRHGHEWTVRADLEAARAAVLPHEDFLIILDLALGVEPCIRACRELRAVSPNGSGTILIAGECPQGDDLEAFLAAGADDFLTDLEDAGHLALRLAVARQHHRKAAVGQRDLHLQNVLDNMPDFLVVVDRDATIRFVNRGVPQAPPEALLEANGFRFIAPEDQESCRAAFEQVLDTGKAQRVEMTDVFGHWWACRLVPMIEDGRIHHVMLICTDITDLKTTTLQLEKERRLLRKMLDLHEHDRRLIACEIHDGFAQQLTGARFNLEAFDRLQEKDPEDARKLFRLGLELLSSGITEARRLISGLRPPVLDELGVVAAVEYLVAEAREQGGPQIEFSKEVEFERLAQPLESAIFRIIQESLANARSYSQSDKVHVKLLQQGDHLKIGIDDWGVGFTPEDVKEDRFGLQSIRERARLMGGEATIEAVPGEGTHVVVEIPLVGRVDP